MKGLKLTALILVSVILVLCSILYLAGFGTEKTVLRTAHYEELATKTKFLAPVHEEMQAAVSDAVQENIRRGKVPKEMEKELAAMVTRSFERAFDLAWLEEQFLVVTDDVVSVAKGKRTALTAVIELREGRQRMKGYLLEEIKAFTGGLPADVAERQVEQMLTGHVPDKIYLAELVRENGVNRDVQKAVMAVGLFRRCTLYLPYLLFPFLFIICCQLAGIPAGTVWFGCSVMLSGIVFAGGLLIAKVLYLRPLIEGVRLPASLAEGLYAAVDFTAGKFMSYSLVFAGIGLLLAAGGLFFLKRAANLSRVVQS